MRTMRAGTCGRGRRVMTFVARVMECRDQIRLRIFLRSFIRSRRYIPSSARRIRSVEELPTALRCHTDGRKDLLWRAWEDGSRVWFVLGGLVNGPTVEDRVGLQLMFFDTDGRLVAAGIWLRTKSRGWLLHTPGLPPHSAYE